MEQIIHEMNPWWQNTYPAPGIIRKKYLEILLSHIEKKDVILVTGLRRIGKTTILRQLISILLKNGIDKKKVCYLTLDALAFKDASIQDLVQKFRQIQNIPTGEKIYLFLDEVTYKQTYSQELKNLYDRGTSKIYASSSSASLLKNKRSLLSGRSRTIEVDPLDFNEFLEFKNIQKRISDKHLLENNFLEYMKLGGIPEYVLTGDPAYISGLTDDIIDKDIIAQRGIRKGPVLKDLFKLLCERVGKTLSYNKLAKVLGTSHDTIKEYIGYFQESYLFHVIDRKAKPNERIKSEKKIYCADVGIKNIATGFRDLGAVYENLVYLALKSNNPNYIRENGIEIDFWYPDNLIEAKYGSEMTEKQKSLFKSFKAKNKAIASGIDFFL